MLAIYLHTGFAPQAGDLFSLWLNGKWKQLVFKKGGDEREGGYDPLLDSVQAVD